MSCLLLSGPNLNHLTRANAVTASDSDATYSALTALYDGIISVPPHKFGTRAADRAYVADIDQMDGYGNFEGTWVGNQPPGFTGTFTGTGASAKETVNMHGGAAALKLTGGTGTAAQTINYVGKTGEFAQINGWIRGDGTANGVARVRIQNLQTFDYLQADLVTWSSAVADIATQQPAAYANVAVTFQLQSYAKCLADTVTIAVTFISTGSGAALFDDFYVAPGVNFSGIFGSDVDPGIVPTLYWSDDNAAFTSAGTTLVKRPSFFTALATTLYHRYWRQSFIGTNSVQTGTIWVSEWVLGQSIALQRSPNLGIQIEHIPNSVRIGQQPGHVWVAQTGSYDPRLLSLKFRLGEGAQGSSASFIEHRDELVRRLRMGAFPCVIVPISSDPDVCIYGVAVDKKQFEQGLLAMWDCDAGVIEQPTGTGIS